MSDPTIPKTLRQAFRILDQMLSAEEKQTILSQTEFEFCMNQHFGLGLWIRNNWIYPDDGQQGMFAQSSDIYLN